MKFIFHSIFTNLFHFHGQKTNKQQHKKQTEQCLLPLHLEWNISDNARNNAPTPHCLDANWYLMCVFFILRQFDPKIPDL